MLLTPYSRSWEALSGARAIFPLIVGAAPFGIIFGTLAHESGLSFWAAMALSLCVFAGSAQFVAVGLVAAGTAVPLIILTTFVVNLRHALYSASLVPYVGRLNAGWKAAIAFFLTDESFAASIDRFQQPDASDYKHWHYISAAVIMYLNWALFTGVGLTLGSLIPNAAAWGLDFAMVATFIGMVVPYITRWPGRSGGRSGGPSGGQDDAQSANQNANQNANQSANQSANQNNGLAWVRFLRKAVPSPMVITVIVAGVVAAFAYPLPHQLGIVVAAVAGAIAGMLSARISDRAGFGTLVKPEDAP
jgi:4-azaleucine resistance transporter AzlC